MLSPTSGHRDYNRYKYYSALRTGYKHLGQEDAAFLEPPKHVIDQNLFIIHNPFSAPRKYIKPCCLTLIISEALVGEKQSSIVIIFSAWKTMVGTAVTSLPWAF